MILLFLGLEYLRAFHEVLQNLKVKGHSLQNGLENSNRGLKIIPDKH